VLLAEDRLLARGRAAGREDAATRTLRMLLAGGPATGALRALLTRERAAEGIPGKMSGFGKRSPSSGE
jgi:hypothetical protein